jgi:hypothetical protein
MSTLRQFNTPISLSSAALSATHNSNTVANIFTTGGNVGIGTTSPSTRLEVIGPNFTYLNTRSSAVSEFRGARTSNTPETILRLGTGHYFGVNWASSAEFQLYNYSSVNQAANSGLNIRLGAGASDNPDTSIMTLLASGNVGIGTTSPIGVLDARGTGFWGIVRTIPSSFGGESSIGFISNPDGSVGTGPTTSNWLLGTNINGYPLGQFNIRSNALGTASIFTIATNGNIGIGTTSPSAKLDITTSTGGPVIYSSFLTTRNWSITNPTEASGITPIVLNTNNAWDIQTDNISRLFINDNAAAPTIGISTTSPVYTLDVSGTLEASNANGLMLFASSGNLGIGTSSPVYKLDVSGAININSTDGNQAGYITASNEASFNNKLIIQASRGLGGIGFNLVNQGRIMTIVGGTNSAGNVGINTTSPTSDLHVNGNYSNYQNSTTGYLTLNQGWGANAGYVSFHQADGTRKGYIGYGDTTEAFLLQGEGGRKITIATNNVDRITITSGGNVGIATTSPIYTLDVNGTLEASNSNGLMLFASSGNLGIDTTTPDAALSLGQVGCIEQDVNSSYFGANFGTTAGNYRKTGNYANMLMFDTFDGAMKFRNASIGTRGSPITWNERVRINSAGNVGINTTNPSALLDVANGSDSGGTQGGPQISFQYRTSSGGGFRHFVRSRHNAVSANNSGNGVDFFLNNLNTATGSSAPGTGNVCTMSITAAGVGFGTTSPDWPIHVTSNNGNYNWPTSGYYFTPSTTFSPASSGFSPSNSILAVGSITSNTGFFTTSDIRIKKILKQGIQEIDISQIDKLDITKFEYIDKLVHGNDIKLGFIAQNVHEFVPEAVTIRKEFVPNIFKVTSVNNKVIELTGHNLTVGTRIKIMIDEEDRNGTVTEITTIIDENHFCIEYNLENKDKLFIYGTEVDDFKELNYNHIFTLSVGAVQKLRQDVRQLQDKFDKFATFIQEKFPNEIIL